MTDSSSTGIRSRFLALFESEVGGSLPLPVPEDVCNISQRDDGRPYLVARGALSDSPRLLECRLADLEALTDSDFLAGFWGHGANSHAFYYYATDSRIRAGFRLPFGGIYMDNEQAAADLLRFLTGFGTLRSRVDELGIEQLHCIENMGDGHYVVSLRGGETIDYRDSLVGESDMSVLWSPRGRG